MFYKYCTALCYLFFEDVWNTLENLNNWTNVWFIRIMDIKYLENCDICKNYIY